MLESILAIIEILANLTAFGDKAEEFKKIVNGCGILDISMLIFRQLKLMTDIMIEHKIYEPEQKFATYVSKKR